MTVRLVLADDEQLVRSGLRLILEAEDDIEVVGEAGDGAEAVALTRRLDPDVVLMDVQMPGMNGIEATREIVAPVSYTHLRAHETPEHLVCRLLLEKKKRTRLVQAVNEHI